MAITPKPPVKGGRSSKRTVKKIILALAVLLLAVGASVAATWYVLEQRDQTQLLDSGKPVAIYEALIPSFVVTVNHQGRARYMQVSMTMMGRDPEQMKALKAHMPMLRNRLVMLLSEYSYEQLSKPEGKEILIEQATMTVQALALEELGNPVLERLLFTNIVLQ